MDRSLLRSAFAAAVATTSALDLDVEGAEVLQNSNRITVRLRPCDTLARVAVETSGPGAEFEVEVARRLGDTDSPVGGLDPRVEPRVYVRDGFVITLWTFFEPVPPAAVTPSDYADALVRMHAGMRPVDLRAPHFTDRVGEAQALVDDPAQTPDLGHAERDLLQSTLAEYRSAIVRRHAPEQLLHGEPHEGNLLRTERGLLFVDLETCCRGPVEFDVVHASEEVAPHYPNADADLLSECRILMLAMITCWRWDRTDDLPNGRQRAAEWLSQMREELAARRG